MKVDLFRIPVKEIADGYVDSDIEGVRGYHGLLDIRPKYQREFVYNDKQRDAVINSVRHDFPLSVMYWVKKEKEDPNDPKQTIDVFEVLDGQQRTLAICQYINGDYSIDFQYFHNLTDEEQDQIYNYELMVYVCEGTETEELEWFQVINIAGEKLTDQEIRNAIFSGEWLTSAKRYFSKPGCAAVKTAGDYMNGKCNRQELLETAINWVAGGKDQIEHYMSQHQNDEDADELWKDFKNIIDWVKRVFPNYRKEMKKVDWGYLYHKYGSKFQQKDADALEKKITKLLQDPDVSKKQGVWPYVLGEPEKVLSIRDFDDKQKREAYERQQGICPFCHEEGNDTKYELKDMEADHITPWSKGGPTTSENCQMLCKEHNAKKSNKSNKSVSKRDTEENTEQTITDGTKVEIKSL